MADNYDERVLSMRFEHAQFEKGVKKSVKSIEDLKESLDFSDTEKELSSFEKSFDDFSNSTKNSSTSILGCFTNLKDKIADAGYATGGLISNFKNVLKTVANFRLANKALREFESKAKQIGNILGVNQIANLATSLENVSAGLEKYERKIASTKTIANATGLDSKTVDTQLDRLNWFTDETSANFAEMVENIGKFTSVGRGLDESITAMEGIATWGYQSGASITEMNRAMYNLSQAMGTGSVKLIDWKSIENAGMATKEFKEQAIAAAEAAGTLKRKGDKLYTKKGNKLVNSSNFNSTLQQGWFTGDVLMSTLKSYGDFASKVQAYQQKNNMSNARDAISAMDTERLEKRNALLDEFSKKSGKTNEELLKQAQKINEIDDPKKRAAATKTFAAELKKLGISAEDTDRLLKGIADTEETLAEKAFKASQESKSFKDSLNATKDAISTGWMKSFQYIFGDLEGSIKTWTGVTDVLWDLFASGAQDRNDALKSWAEAFNGRADLFDFDYTDAFGNVITDLQKLEKMDTLDYTTGTIRSLADAILAVKEAMKGGIQDTFFPDLANILDDPELTEEEKEQEKFAKRIHEIYESKDKLVSTESLKSLEEAGVLTEKMKENMIKAGLESGDLIEKNGKYYTKKGRMEVNTDNIFETIQKKSWLTQDALKGLLETNSDTADAIDGVWTPEERKRYRQAKYFGEKIKAITTTVKDFANKIRNFFEDSENMANMQKAFGGLASIVKLVLNVAKAVGKAVSGFLNRTQVLQKILAVLGNLGAEVTDWVNNFLASEKLNKAAKFIEDVFVGIFDAVSWFIDVFSKWDDIFKSFFSESGLSELISGWINGIKEALFGKNKIVNEEDPAGLNAILNWFKNLKTQIESYDLQGLLNRILDAINLIKQFFGAKDTIDTEGLTENQKKLYSVLEKYELVTDKIKEYWASLKSLYSRFKAWLNSSGITPFIKEKWALLTSYFATISADIQKISFAEILKQVWGNIKKIFGDIRAFLDKIGLTNFIKAKWAVLKDAVKNFNIHDLSDKLLGIKEDIKSGGLLDKIKDKWATFTAWLKGLNLDEIGQGIADQASKMWNKIMSIFVGSAGAEEFVDGVSEPPLMVKVGNQIDKLKSMAGGGEGASGEGPLGKFTKIRERFSKYFGKKKNKGANESTASSGTDNTFNLLDEFKEKWDKFKKWFKGIDWNHISEVFNGFSDGLSKILIGLAIFKGASNLTKAGEGISDGLKSVAGMFDKLTDGVNSFLEGKAKAEEMAAQAKLDEANKQKKDPIGTTILKIAGAVAIMAVAIKLLSEIEPEKLKTGLIALGGILLALALITLVVGGLEKKFNVDVGSSVFKIAGAIMILAAAAWLLKDINAVRIAAIAVTMKTLTKALVEIMNMLVAANSKLDAAKTKQLKKTSTLVMKISAAMVILAKACSILAKYNTAQIIQGVLGIKILLKSLAEAMRTIGESDTKDVKTGPIIAMSISVWLLSKVVKILAKMEVVDAIKGITGVSILLSKLSKAMKKANSGKGTASSGAAILGMALAVGILVKVIKKLAEMDFGFALKGIALMELIISRLSAAIKKANSGKGTKADALSILAMGIAVRILVKVVKDLSKMSLKDGLKGTIELGLILSALGKSIRKANSGSGTKAGIVVIIGMAIAVKMLSKVVKDLSNLKATSALKGIITISILMSKFSKMFKKTSSSFGGVSSKDDRNPIWNLMGQALMMLAMAKSVSMIADACAKLGNLKAKTLVKGIAALGAVVIGFKQLSKILAGDKLKFGKAIILILTMAASLYLVADLFKGIQNVNMDPGVKFAGALSAILISFGLTFALLDGISFGSIMASMLKLVAVIAIVAGLIAAIGAVAGDGKEVMKLFEQGGNILESLGIAIGRGIGGLIAGIGLAISDSLPTIGKNIRSFMDSFDGMKDPGLIVSDKTVTGFVNLFKIIGLMAGTEVIESITNFILNYGKETDEVTGEVINGDDMFTHFIGIVTQLTSLFTELRGKDFTLTDFKVDEDAPTKIGSLMGVVAAIAGTDLVTVISNWVTGLFQEEGDKKDIFAQFITSMTSLQTLFGQLSTIGALSLGSFTIEKDAPGAIASLMGVIAAIAGTDLVTAISNWVTGLFQKEGDKKDIFDQFAASIGSIKKLFDELSEIGPLELGEFSIQPGAADKISSIMKVVAAIAGTDLITSISEWATKLFKDGNTTIFDQFASTIGSLKLLFDALSVTGPLTLGEFTIDADAADKIANVMKVVAAIGVSDIVTSITNFVSGLFQVGDKKENIFDQFSGTIESIQTLFTKLNEHPLPELNMTISKDTVDAFGQLFEIIKIVGQSAAVRAISNFIAGKDSFKQFKDDIVILSEALVSFKENIAQFESIEVSADAMKNAKDIATGISDFAKRLPTDSKSLFGRIIGIQDLGDFSDDIKDFAEALYTWAVKTKDFPSYDKGSKNSAINAAEGLRDFASTLTDESVGTGHYGLFGMLTDDETKIDKFSSNVISLAQAMKEFGGIGEFSNDTEHALDAINKIAEISKILSTTGSVYGSSLSSLAYEMVEIFGSGSKDPSAEYDIIGALNRLSSGLIIDDGKITSATVAIKNIALAAEAISSTDASDMDSLGKNLAELFTAFIDAGGFSDSGAEMAQKFVEGFVTELKNETTGANVKSGAEKVRTALSDYINGTWSSNPFYSLGKNVTYGFAHGMLDVVAVGSLVANAKWLGSKALETLQERIDSNSPSKEFMKIGGYSALGYAEGLGDYGNTIGQAAAGMGKDALESAKTSLGLFSTLLTDGVDDQPTIRPVLDLSNVTAGAERLNGMLGNKSFNIAGNVAAGLLPDGLYTEKGRASGTTESTPFDPTGVINSINGINEHLNTLDTHMSNLRVVMNSGALVGQIVSDMDRALGKRSLKSNVAL